MGKQRIVGLATPIRDQCGGGGVIIVCFL